MFTITNYLNFREEIFAGEFLERTTAIERDKAMQACINDCIDCQAVCMETMNYCLGMGGRHAEQSHIRLLLDCSEICRITADFMLRGSDFSIRSADLCAEACEKCARSCNRFTADEFMKTCADVCRRCMDSCREMVGLGMPPTA